MFNVDEIIALIKTIDQSSIQRFELEQEAARLIIVREASGPATAVILPPAAAEREEAPVRTLPGKSDRTVSQPAGDAHTIVSPLIGNFYAAAEPGAEPFIKVGQKVNADTVVCVVEAMKLFNEIEAGIKGEIIEVLVKNEEFVEYGQPLFRVRPE